MKAAVIHQYGGPQELKYEDMPDPKPGPGQVLVRVHAASINPVDWKIRSGAAKERFPVEFPAILGRDLAGTIEQLGSGVTGCALGDRVMAVAWSTYAALCIVKASDLTSIPPQLTFDAAAAVPLAALTGHQLIHLACKLQPGQTVLVTGALGSVGRCAVFAAQQLGAKVTAGVRKRQLEEARSLGVDAIDLGDSAALAALPLFDAIADTVGHDLATHLLPKVKPGGNFGSVLGPVAGSDAFPQVHVNPIMAHPDPETVLHFAQAVASGQLKIPIGLTLPLAQAAQAQQRAEQGGIAKVILTP